MVVSRMPDATLPMGPEALARALVDAVGEKDAAWMIEDAAADLRGDSVIAMRPQSCGLGVIDFDRWQGAPPEREFYWGQFLPRFQTTMLSGAGGVGKSLLAQQLLTCIALGRPFLGVATMPAPTLYVTCEDDHDELWRRQEAICRAIGVGLDSLRGRLHLVSLCGATETALASLDSNGRLRPTDLWLQYRATVEERGVKVFAFDNATDAMAGDLNDIHQVAEFVNLLTSLAIEQHAAGLILHHPNKAGEDWLGSVAWHNKVRSRWGLKGADEGVDPNLRSLVNPKSNYGPSGASLSFRWFDGAFRTDDEVPDTYLQDMAESAQAASDNATFLACLRQRTKEQRSVSGSPSPTYAPVEFAKMPQSKGVGRKRLEGAMNRLFHLGAIEMGDLPWRKKDRHAATGLRETGAVNAADTAGNAAGNAAVDTCGERGERLGKAAVNLAANAAERNPLSKEREAAPSGWPPLADEDLDYGDGDGGGDVD